MGLSVFPVPSAGGLSVRKSQTFASSGTFTLPSGYGVSKPLVVDLEICGGGGGGGAGAYSTSANASGGGGGGSGVTTVFNGVSLTANATITIGAGGSGGAAGSGGNANFGANGGASDVNSTFYSPGGGGGGGGGNNSATRYSRSVITYGYRIPGGYQATTSIGPGGGGGSGGAASQGLASNPVSGLYYSGGIYGSPGGTYTDNTDQAAAYLDYGSTREGKGLAMIPAVGNSATSGGINVVPLPLQRGGGGAGGWAETTGTHGSGGGAGTRNEGGLTGIRGQGTGGLNGTAATVAGCGGGGGGGAINFGIGVGGAGGNGAAGYVTIYWWE